MKSTISIAGLGSGYRYILKKKKIDEHVESEREVFGCAIPF